MGYQKVITSKISDAVIDILLRAESIRGGQVIPVINTYWTKLRESTEQKFAQSKNYLSTLYTLNSQTKIMTGLIMDTSSYNKFEVEQVKNWLSFSENYQSVELNGVNIISKPVARKKVNPTVIYIPYANQDSGIGKSNNKKYYSDSKLNLDLNKWNTRNGIALQYHAANFIPK